MHGSATEVQKAAAAVGAVDPNEVDEDGEERLLISLLYVDCSATGPPPSTLRRTSPDLPFPNV